MLPQGQDPQMTESPGALVSSGILFGLKFKLFLNNRFKANIKFSKMSTEEESKVSGKFQVYHNINKNNRLLMYYTSDDPEEGDGLAFFNIHDDNLYFFTMPPPENHKSWEKLYRGEYAKY